MAAEDTGRNAVQNSGDEPKSEDTDVEKNVKSLANEQGPVDEKGTPGSGTSVDPNVVDWDGSDDPTNPRNWSNAYKMLNVGLVSLSVLYA